MQLHGDRGHPRSGDVADGGVEPPAAEVVLANLHHRCRDHPRRPVPNRIIDIEQQLCSTHPADAPLQRRVRAFTPPILAGRGALSLGPPAAPNTSGCKIRVRAHWVRIVWRLSVGSELRRLVGPNRLLLPHVAAVGGLGCPSCLSVMVRPPWPASSGSRPADVYSGLSCSHVRTCPACSSGGKIG